MSTQGKYNSNLEPRFDFREVIDIPKLVADCKEQWYNQTLCRVNDSVIRLGILQGEFHWHKHDQEDEFFFALQGELLIDIGTETVKLAPHQGYAVPKGVLHRTRAPGRTVVMMVERCSVTPTGDPAAPR